MMGAAQPFISGAISKTVNMPNESTVDDIRDAYVQAWKMGLKCVAIYRDGSKRSQPLNTKRTNEGGDKAAAPRTPTARRRGSKNSRPRWPSCASRPGKPLRRRLSDTRTAITHKFDIAGHEGYLTVGLFEDGQPGELFITMAKEGSTIGGLMDGIGTLTSLALQYGVPLEALVRKFAHVRFEPSGLPRTPRSATPRRSPTTYSAGWPSSSFPGYREETPPTATSRNWPFPGWLEELKKKINRPVPELPHRRRHRDRGNGKPSRQWPVQSGERTLSAPSKL